MSPEIIIGDCAEVMSYMPSDSVDSIVTDPPYGLGFMGMKWDVGVPAVDVFEECLRVLKPGGHLLAFGGSRTYHRLAVAVEDAGFEIRDQIMWIYGSGMPKSRALLKPAHEPIVMARKPAGKATPLRIDDCRVHPTGESRERVGEPSQETRYADRGSVNLAAKPGVRGGDPKGRFPANVIHDGSAEVLDSFPDAPGQIAKAATGKDRRKSQHCYGAMAHGSNGADPRADNTKSAARFFYCAKANKTDRGDGNTHPTVKPTNLMRYLCRLVTPPGGTVLDPFAGSGSTGKAAALEGFAFIGIEKEPEYAEVAEARISAVQGDDCAVTAMPSSRRSSRSSSARTSTPQKINRKLRTCDKVDSPDPGNGVDEFGL